MNQDSPEIARRPRARFGLLPRLVAALAVVGLMPLAALSWQLVGLNQEAMTEQVLRTHAVAADAAASRLRSELQSRRGFVRSAAETLGRSGSTDPVGERPARLLADGEGLGAVAVVHLGSGEPWIARRDPAPDELVGRLPRLDPEAETFVRSEGTLWLAMRYGPAAVLFDTVDSTRSLHPLELGSEASVHLLHDRDTVWASSPTTVPDGLVDLAAARLSGSGRFDSAGSEYLGAFAPVTDSPWIVVSLQTAAAAERVGRTMHRRSAWAVFGAVLAVLLLSAAGFRTVIRPLRDLIGQAERVLPTGPDSATSEVGDEVSRLSMTFDALARHVVRNEELDQIFLGRYQVLEIIGEGAMGSVFMGWDPTLKRTVALKTLKVSGDRRNRGEADDLLAEAVTIAGLNHPNIVQVHDVGQETEVDFIAMEYVRGSSLRAHLGAGPLSIPLTLHVCLEVAEALAAAHAVDVLHNDIKPGNILLREDGRTKITDFGISQAMDQIGSEEGLVYGTPGYLSPETISGTGRDERSDLFALGVTAYECLVGSKPFLGPTVHAVLSQTLMANPPAPGSMRQGVPPELDRLISDLLHKEPEHRVADAGQAVDRFAKLAKRYPWDGSTAPADPGAAETLSSMIPTQLIDSAGAEAPQSLKSQTLTLTEHPITELGDDA